MSKKETNASLTRTKSQFARELQDGVVGVRSWDCVDWLAATRSVATLIKRVLVPDAGNLPAVHPQKLEY